MGKKTLLKSRIVEAGHFSSRQTKKSSDDADGTNHMNNINQVTRCVVRFIEATSLLASDADTGKSDPVGFACLGDIHSEPTWTQEETLREGVLMTDPKKATIKPIWNCDLTFPVSFDRIEDLEATKIYICIKDEDEDPTQGTITYENLGKCSISLKEVVEKGKKVKGNAIVDGPRWIKLEKCADRRKVDGSVRVTLSLIFQDDSQSLLQSLGLNQPAEIVNYLKNAVVGKLSSSRPSSADLSSSKRSSSPGRQTPRVSSPLRMNFTSKQTLPTIHDDKEIDIPQGDFNMPEEVEVKVVASKELEQPIVKNDSQKIIDKADSSVNLQPLHEELKFWKKRALDADNALKHFSDEERPATLSRVTSNTSMNDLVAEINRYKSLALQSEKELADFQNNLAVTNDNRLLGDCDIPDDPSANDDHDQKLEFTHTNKAIHPTQVASVAGAIEVQELAKLLEHFKSLVKEQANQLEELKKVKISNELEAPFGDCDLPEEFPVQEFNKNNETTENTSLINQKPQHKKEIQVERKDDILRNPPITTATQDNSQIVVNVQVTSSKDNTDMPNILAENHSIKQPENPTSNPPADTKKSAIDTVIVASNDKSQVEHGVGEQVENILPKSFPDTKSTVSSNNQQSSDIKKSRSNSLAKENEAPSPSQASTTEYDGLVGDCNVPDDDIPPVEGKGGIEERNTLSGDVKDVVKPDSQTDSPVTINMQNIEDLATAVVQYKAIAEQSAKEVAELKTLLSSQPNEDKPTIPNISLAALKNLPQPKIINEFTSKIAKQVSTVAGQNLTPVASQLAEELKHWKSKLKLNQLAIKSLKKITKLDEYLPIGDCDMPDDPAVEVKPISRQSSRQSSKAQIQSPVSADVASLLHEIEYWKTMAAQLEQQITLLKVPQASQLPIDEMEILGDCDLPPDDMPLSQANLSKLTNNTRLKSLVGMVSSRNESETESQRLLKLMEQWKNRALKAEKENLQLTQQAQDEVEPLVALQKEVIDTDPGVIVESMSGDQAIPDANENEVGKRGKFSLKNLHGRVQLDLKSPKFAQIARIYMKTMKSLSSLINKWNSSSSSRNSKAVESIEKDIVVSGFDLEDLIHGDMALPDNTPDDGPQNRRSLSRNSTRNNQNSREKLLNPNGSTNINPQNMKNLVRLMKRWKDRDKRQLKGVETVEFKKMMENLEHEFEVSGIDWEKIDLQGDFATPDDDQQQRSNRQSYNQNHDQQQQRNNQQRSNDHRRSSYNHNYDEANNRNVSQQQRDAGREAARQRINEARQNFQSRNNQSSGNLFFATIGGQDDRSNSNHSKWHDDYPRGGDEAQPSDDDEPNDRNRSQQRRRNNDPRQNFQSRSSNNRSNESLIGGQNNRSSRNQSKRNDNYPGGGDEAIPSDDDTVVNSESGGDYDTGNNITVIRALKEKSKPHRDGKIMRNYHDDEVAVMEPTESRRSGHLTSPKSKTMQISSKSSKQNDFPEENMLLNKTWAGRPSSRLDIVPFDWTKALELLDSETLDYDTAVKTVMKTGDLSDFMRMLEIIGPRPWLLSEAGQLRVYDRLSSALQKKTNVSTCFQWLDASFLSSSSHVSTMGTLPRKCRENLVTSLAYLSMEPSSDGVKAAKLEAKIARSIQVMP